MLEEQCIGRRRTIVCLVANLVVSLVVNMQVIDLDGCWRSNALGGGGQ